MFSSNSILPVSHHESSARQLDLNSWFALRQKIESDVFTSVSMTSQLLQIKGSFATGNFHLSRSRLSTFSDVDLVLPGVAENDRHLVEATVENFLAERGMSIRVSVQPRDTTQGMTTHESQLLLLGSHLRWLKRSRTEPGFAEFLLAKSFLLVLDLCAMKSTFAVIPLSRSELRQTRLDALRVRTGEGAPLPEDDIRRILHLLRVNSPSLYWLERLLMGEDVEPIRNWFIKTLRQTNIDPWLVTRMEELATLGTS